MEFHTEENNSGLGYPEGGLQECSVVLGAWCAMIPSMGLLNSLGVLQAWTNTHQLKDFSDSSIGWVFGAYGFFLYVAGAQAGLICDTYGPRYVIIPGSTGMILLLVLLSFSEEYYQIFLSFSVLGGLSASMLFTPAVSTIGHWINIHCGWATSVACTAGGIGGVLFPLIIIFAGPKIGFSWVICATALLSAVLCMIASFLLKERLPLNKKAGASVDFCVLMDLKYVSMTAAIFLVEFTVFILITYIASYAIHVGLDDTMSYLLIAFLNLGAISGRFLPGLIADRISRFNVMVFTSLPCSILTLALWYETGRNSAAIVSYAILFGFWSGATISLTLVCISQVCTTGDYGKRLGMTYTISSIGTLTGIPIAGAIQQQSGGDYGLLIIFGGLLYVAATLTFVLAWGICCRWSLKTRF